MIPAFALIGFQHTITITKTIQGEAVEKARSDLQTGLAIIDLKYPGDWNVKEGKLHKGETLIDGNEEIVDRIGELTGGDTATIFLGDTRVATNVTIDGKRATGTQASEIVKKTVLGEGKLYLGQANVVGHTYQAAYMPIKDSAGSIIGMWYVGAPDASERILEIKRDTLRSVVLQAVVVLGIVLALNFLLTRPIIRRIESSAELLQSIADGDLARPTPQVKSGDETGALLKAANRMTDNLRSIISRVQDTSEQVAASSEQLTASAEQTSKAAEQIASAIQEVAAGAGKQLDSFTAAGEAASEISRGMDQAAHLIQDMSESTDQGNDKAKSGTRTVALSIEQMGLIEQSVGQTAEVVRALGEKSKDIGHIVDVMTQIANQTNLLALNAAIEAARAGEEGRGFGVVAGEVRKLSEQSESAAEEIRVLIGQVQSQSSQAVQAMDEGTEVVREGMRRVHEAGAAFEEIAGSMADISVKSQEVAAIVEQVSAHSQSMVQTMDQATDIARRSFDHTNNVASSAEEQNASMEEIAASAEHLGRMAEDLQTIANRFKV